MCGWRHPGAAHMPWQADKHGDVGHSREHQLILCSPSKVGPSIRPTLHTEKLRLKCSVCPSDLQATELGASIQDLVELCRGAPGSPPSTHICDNASVSPFCKMMTKRHDLIGWL